MFLPPTRAPASLPSRQKVRSWFGFQTWFHYCVVVLASHECSASCCTYLFSVTFQSVVKLLTPFSQLTNKSLNGTTFHFHFTFIFCWDDLDSCWWPQMKGLLSHCHWPDPCSCSFLRHLHGYVKVLLVEGDAVDAEQGKHWRGAHLLQCITEKLQVKKPL